MTDHVEDRCPRCGEDLSPTAAHCRECFLRLRDDGTPEDPRLGLMRSAWERQHPDEARAWDPHHVEEAATAAAPLPPRTKPTLPRDALPPLPFEPLDSRAQWASRALIATVVLSVVSIVFGLFEIELIDRVAAGEPVTFAEIDGNDTRQGVLGIARLAVYVVTAVLFIRWFVAAYRNAPAVGGPQRYGSGWAIGGWFVPILWLWRPKEIANDIADAAGGASGLVTAWWALWLIGNWLGGIVLRLYLRGDTADELLTADYVGVASDALDVVTAVLAIRVVQVLTRRLTEAHAARTAAA